MKNHFLHVLFYCQFLAELPISSTLHREIVLTMKASFILRAYLMFKDTRKSAMKNKTGFLQI